MERSYVTPLHRDTLAAVATPGYVAGRTLPLKPEEIAAMTLGYNKGWRDDWTKWFEAAGYEGSPSGIMMDYDNRARMLDLALAGHGAVLCDLVLAAAEIAAGHLVQIHPATIETGRGMWVVFPETATPDPSVLCFRTGCAPILGLKTSRPRAAEPADAARAAVRWSAPRARPSSGLRPAGSSGT